MIGRERLKYFPPSSIPVVAIKSVSEMYKRYFVSFIDLFAISWNTAYAATIPQVHKQTFCHLTQIMFCKGDFL